MRNFLKRLSRDEGGATAIEYGIIAAMMTVAIIAGISAVTPNLISDLTNIGTKLVVS